MRADRLLQIMLLLQTRGSMPARELAAKLEVSERTIFRDMEALSSAGVPVYAERGAQGGWRLAEGYRTDWTGLSREEIISLMAAKPHRHVNDLGWSGSFDAALLKLLASLSPTLRRDVAYTKERLHVDGAGWHPYIEDVPLLPLLQEAVWEGRQLRIDYSSGRGNGGCRIVHPLGLVAKGSLWYLVAVPEEPDASGSAGGDAAQAGGAGVREPRYPGTRNGGIGEPPGADAPNGGGEPEPRSYRVSRIRAAELLPAPARRPDGFELAAYWERSVRRFREELPRYPARALVHEDARARLGQTRFVRVAAWGEPEAGGRWQEAALEFDTLESACGIALGFGSQLRILEPPELRGAIIAAAHSVLALYGENAENRQ